MRLSLVLLAMCLAACDGLGNPVDPEANPRSVENPSLRRIAPNDPANSYLYRRITGAGITGDRMPQELPPLRESRLALVRNCIRRGAPND